MDGSGSPAVVAFPDGCPLLQVVVDTEEEFDWSEPFRRDRVSVESMDAQWRAQELFDAYGVKPTYVIDHPVATTARSVEILKAFLDEGRCQIGTHLHPWVNPPFAEAVSAFTSYPGNLEPALERRKLEILHEAISCAFSLRPMIYKAGRYGIGPNTACILSSLGYVVDLSVVPLTDFSGDGGPDFRGFPDRPFWLDRAGGILEIPLTRGFSGAWTGRLGGAALRERASLAVVPSEAFGAVAARAAGTRDPHARRRRCGRPPQAPPRTGARRAQSVHAQLSQPVARSRAHALRARPEAVVCVPGHHQGDARLVLRAPRRPRHDAARGQGDGAPTAIAGRLGRRSLGRERFPVRPPSARASPPAVPA